MPPFQVCVGVSGGWCPQASVHLVQGRSAADTGEESRAGGQPGEPVSLVCDGD